MRDDVEAALVGAASVMDLSGQTVIRYSRSLGTDSVEKHLALMALVRRGQMAMFVATIFILLTALVLLLNHEALIGGFIVIPWTVLSFAVSLFVGWRVP